MKKITAFLLSLTLALGFGAVAFADPGDGVIDPFDLPVVINDPGDGGIDPK